MVLLLEILVAVIYIIVTVLVNTIKNEQCRDPDSLPCEVLQFSVGQFDNRSMDSSDKCYNCTLLQAAAKWNVNNTVLLMMVDKGYLYQFLNIYVVGNLKQYGNLLVVSLDPKSFQFLQDLNIHVILLHNVKQSTEEFTPQKSLLFAKKMQNKLDIIVTVLKGGFNVLYMDSDVILLQNPFPYLFGVDGYEILAQKDATICTGFMFIYPTNNTIELFSKSIGNRTGDQLTIIHAFKRMKTVKLQLLPSYLFSSGEVFWKDHTFYWDPISPKQIMIHNNFVRHKDNKDYRFKEMHLYALDVNGEYSNPNARYLTIEYVSKNVTNDLIQAVKIANALKRTLVIPPIPCPGRKGYCLTCAYDKFGCLRSILIEAEYGYRESVFFTNDKIPQNIRNTDMFGDVYHFRRNCSNNSIILKSTFQARTQNRNHLICMPCNSSLVSCVSAAFADSSNTVLKLYSSLKLL